MYYTSSKPPIIIVFVMRCFKLLVVGDMFHHRTSELLFIFIKDRKCSRFVINSVFGLSTTLKCFFDDPIAVLFEDIINVEEIWKRDFLWNKRPDIIGENKLTTLGASHTSFVGHILKIF